MTGEWGGQMKSVTLAIIPKWRSKRYSTPRGKPPLIKWLILTLKWKL